MFSNKEFRAPIILVFGVFLLVVLSSFFLFVKFSEAARCGHVAWGVYCNGCQTCNIPGYPNSPYCTWNCYPAYCCGGGCQDCCNSGQCAACHTCSGYSCSRSCPPTKCCGGGCQDCCNSGQCPACHTCSGYSCSRSCPPTKCCGGACQDCCNSGQCPACHTCSGYSCSRSCPPTKCCGGACQNCCYNYQCPACHTCSGYSCAPVTNGTGCSGGYCYNGICRDCINNSHCLDDEKCVNHQCVALNCSECQTAVNHSCAPVTNGTGCSGGYCYNGICRNCINDSHCAVCHTCSNYNCVTATNGTGCSGGICYNGICRDCYNDSHCLETETCSNYQCVALNCPACQTAVNHACQWSCLPEKCCGGACQECCNGDQCNSDQECNNYQCVDLDCPECQKIVNHECVADSSQNSVCCRNTPFGCLDWCYEGSCSYGLAQDGPVCAEREWRECNAMCANENVWCNATTWTNSGCASGWVNNLGYQIPVTCCNDSDCHNNPDYGECYKCTGEEDVRQCEYDNGKACGEAGNVCYDGSCVNPDLEENQSACSSVSWDCTSDNCQDTGRGYWEYPLSGYSSSYVNQGAFHGGADAKCCGNDPGEQVLHNSWWSGCVGSCGPNEYQVSYCKCYDNETDEYLYTLEYVYAETNNCCGAYQCAWGHGCRDNQGAINPSWECYDYDCWLIDGIADLGSDSCPADHACEYNQCVYYPPCECSAGDDCCSDGCNYDSVGTQCGLENCGQCDASRVCSIGIPDVADYNMPGNCVYDNMTISRPNTNIHISAGASMTLTNGTEIAIQTFDIANGTGDAIFINSGTTLILQN